MSKKLTIDSNFSVARYKVSIIEYYKNEAEMGSILAKNIAWAMNIGDDYRRYSPRSKVPREASDGTSCTDVGGFMDYYPSNPTQ